MTLTYDVITYTRPDGVVIDLTSPPYMMNGYDGFGITDFELTTVSPPGVNGEYWYDTRMNAKVVTLDFSYYGDGVEDRQNNRRSVISLFNPTLGPGVLHIDQVNGASYEMDCILSDVMTLPSDDFLGVGAYHAVVHLKSHGIPALRVPTINTQNVVPSTASGNVLFPWTFPRVFAQSGFFNTITITNAGDINAPIRISMNGPLSSPIFRNNTTDKALSFPGLILAIGDTLLIDTDPSKYVVQVNGVDAWQNIQDADFWDLAPGNNIIIFDIAGTDAVNTSGQLNWYTRYLGS